MIAADTHVLVRLFVNDDAAQATKARAPFGGHADEDDSLWIADVVLAELVWALDRSYGRPRSDIVTVLRALSGNATVHLESAACMSQATTLYERGRADFVDCLLAVKARALNCDALRTFDKKMKGLPGVVTL